MDTKAIDLYLQELKKDSNSSSPVGNANMAEYLKNIRHHNEKNF